METTGAAPLHTVFHQMAQTLRLNDRRIFGALNFALNVSNDQRASFENTLSVELGLPKTINCRATLDNANSPPAPYYMPNVRARDT